MKGTPGRSSGGIDGRTSGQLRRGSKPERLLVGRSDARRIVSLVKDRTILVVRRKPWGGFRRKPRGERETQTERINGGSCEKK